MITHTFSILPGIGEVTEQRFWRAGFLSWEDFLEAGSVRGCSPSKKRLYDGILQEARSSLEAGDPAFFMENLKQRDHWRLWPWFRRRAMALDIETNGLPPRAGGIVTLVGLFDGYDFHALLSGRNLSREALAERLGPCPYLLTFFGSGFDLPFLRDALCYTWQGLHFDLCFAGKRTGLHGAAQAHRARAGHRAGGGGAGI